MAALLGARVRKTDGYRFEGWVVAEFLNRQQQHRVVVEHDDGWCFIFAPSQLEQVKT